MEFRNKIFWINGNFSYAVNIFDNGNDEDYRVEELIDKEVIQQITKIGEKVIKVLPKISFNNKKSLPVMVRIDFTCCQQNKKFSPSNYFVNEIESDIVELILIFQM